MKLIEPIVAWRQDIAAIRRDIHAHPELAFEEFRTADVVAARLQEWGIEVDRGLGGTGVVGIIRGTREGPRAVGLRADMDALPMQEANTFEHASRNPGKMHACGHDGHTAMLLAAARFLVAAARFRRHRVRDLPTGRGRRRRRQAHDRRWPVHPLPHGSGIRHA